MVEASSPDPARACFLTGDYFADDARSATSLDPLLVALGAHLLHAAPAQLRQSPPPGSLPRLSVGLAASLARVPHGAAPHCQRSDDRDGDDAATR